MVYMTFLKVLTFCTKKKQHYFPQVHSTMSDLTVEQNLIFIKIAEEINSSELKNILAICDAPRSKTFKTGLGWLIFMRNSCRLEDNNVNGKGIMFFVEKCVEDFQARAAILGLFRQLMEITREHKRKIVPANREPEPQTPSNRGTDGRPMSEQELRERKETEYNLVKKKLAEMAEEQDRKKKESREKESGEIDFNTTVKQQEVTSSNTTWSREFVKVAENLKHIESFTTIEEQERHYSPADTEFSLFITKLDADIPPAHISIIIYTIPIYYECSSAGIVEKNVISQLLHKGLVWNNSDSLKRLVVLLCKSSYALEAVVTRIQKWIDKIETKATCNESHSSNPATINQPTSSNTARMNQPSYEESFDIKPSLREFVLELQKHISQQDSYMMQYVVGMVFEIPTSVLPDKNLIVHMVETGNIVDTEASLSKLCKVLTKTSSGLNYLEERVKSRIREINSISLKRKQNQPEIPKSTKHPLEEDLNHPKNKAPRNGLCVKCNERPIAVAIMDCGCASKCGKCYTHKSVCESCGRYVRSFIEFSMK